MWHDTCMVGNVEPMWQVVWHIHGKWHGVYLHIMSHDICVVGDVEFMWQVMWHIHGKWHGVYVVDDMAKKQQLFVFVDRCVDSLQH
jgi:hypothetical protein